MSIQVENLTKTYGSQKAIDSISFEVKRGEIVGFLGPNGAGKSTTMKILTANISASGGEASVNGFSVSEDNMSVKKSVGYLAEHNPLYLEMYVKEFLSFVANVHDIKDESRISEVIKLVGLEREQHKKVSQLSKGYRQRVGIAQAIIHNPEVLILDEPTTGLDPSQLVEIRSLIKEIGKDKTVLFSTHIMQEVENLCDRVIVLSKGEIKANDTVENLTSRGNSMEEVFLSLL